MGLDQFTKFAFAVPMSKIDSENVARVLIDRWISFCGVPLEIHSDSVSQLISDVTKKVYGILGIKLTNSLPYVSRQNGAAEKLVFSIKSMLRHFAEIRKKIGTSF